MAHHGENSEALTKAMQLFSERMSQARAIQQDATSLGLGPTGKYPDGQLNEDDQGQIRIAIGQQNGKVVMSFGRPIAWIGFTKEEAKEIGTALIKSAEPDEVPNDQETN
jgi:hypothetical protein